MMKRFKYQQGQIHFHCSHSGVQPTFQNRRHPWAGAVPKLAEQFLPSTSTTGFWERRQRPPAPEDEREASTPDRVAVDVAMELDCASDPDPAVVDLVSDENASLWEEISWLRERVVMLRQQFGIHRFAALDKGTGILQRLGGPEALRLAKKNHSS